MSGADRCMIQDPGSHVHCARERGHEGDHVTVIGRPVDGSWDLDLNVGEVSHYVPYRLVELRWSDDYVDEDSDEVTSAAI